jgi:hypothetical protein
MKKSNGKMSKGSSCGASMGGAVKKGKMGYKSGGSVKRMSCGGKMK